MKTRFASPERAAEKKLKSEIQLTQSVPLVEELTYLIPDPFVILNQHRQIVYCNKILMELLGIPEPEKIYGLRLGEAINCVHAAEAETGCGTTAFCRYCGATNIIIKSQEEGSAIKEEECRLVAGEGKHSFDFMIRAKALTLLDEIYTIVIIRDIRDEKRRQVLERIFFHDILNIATGLQGALEVMEVATEDELPGFLELAKFSSDTLVEGINAQRDLLAAENENLDIEMTTLNSRDILLSVISIYQNHQVARGKKIKIAGDTVSKDFISDSRLLKRIIGNMSKNALEAETKGQIITLGAKEKNKKIEFWVHNPTIMPEEAKMQMFQRSFSTKGSGRGLGTYSIKLLGEGYLKGKVTFISEENLGTTFYLELPIS